MINMLCNERNWKHGVTERIALENDAPEDIARLAMDMAQDTLGEAYTGNYVYTELAIPFMEFYKLGVESTQEK
jgi:hypothetical protein